MDEVCCIKIVKLPPADAAKLAHQLPIVDISEDCKNRKVNVQTILDFIEKRFGLVPGGINPEIPPILLPTPQPAPIPTSLPIPRNPPPFIGGQCDCRGYYVSTTITDTVDNTVSARTSEVYGPVGGVVKIIKDGHINFEIVCKGQVTGNGCRNDINHGIGSIANGAINGLQDRWVVTLTGITTIDGNPDNCGNPAPIESSTPSPTPTPVPIPAPIPSSPSYIEVAFKGGQCGGVQYQVFIDLMAKSVDGRAAGAHDVAYPVYLPKLGPLVGLHNTYGNAGTAGASWFADAQGAATGNVITQFSFFPRNHDVTVDRYRISMIKRLDNEPDSCAAGPVPSITAGFFEPFKKIPPYTGGLCVCTKYRIQWLLVKVDGGIYKSKFNDSPTVVGSYDLVWGPILGFNIRYPSPNEYIFEVQCRGLAENTGCATNNWYTIDTGTGDVPLGLRAMVVTATRDDGARDYCGNIAMPIPNQYVPSGAKITTDASGYTPEAPQVTNGSEYYDVTYEFSNIYYSYTGANLITVGPKRWKGPIGNFELRNGLWGHSHGDGYWDGIVAVLYFGNAAGANYVYSKPKFVSITPA